jgi:ribosomal protein L24E
MLFDQKLSWNLAVSKRTGTLVVFKDSLVFVGKLYVCKDKCVKSIWISRREFRKRYEVVGVL